MIPRFQIPDLTLVPRCDPGVASAGEPRHPLVASAFPSAWVIGRLGCAVAHDHPGRASSVWWAVAYPGVPRLGMGLTEAAVTLLLAVVFLWQRRHRRPNGFFLASACLHTYAPIRFTLDFSHATDIAGAYERYLRLTPAPWGRLGLLWFRRLCFEGGNSPRLSG